VSKTPRRAPPKAPRAGSLFQLSARKTPFNFRKDGPHTTVAVMCRTTAWAFSRGDPFADQQVPILYVVTELAKFASSTWRLRAHLVTGLPTSRRSLFFSYLLYRTAAARALKNKITSNNPHASSLQHIGDLIRLGETSNTRR
jgi:hypothetical protein